MGMAIYPVVLAGGSGTRLWPLSRENHPKQFLDVLGCGETLLQTTIKRAQVCSDELPLIIASQHHRFIVQQQIQNYGLSAANVLLEPDSKNTTGAIALACLKILNTDPNGMLLILPSDHFLPDMAQFKLKTMNFAADLKEGEIGLFGIKPSYPATQYGYISFTAGKHNTVERFIEKPSLETAESLISQEGAAWNSGMVLSHVSTVLSALQAFEPELMQQVRCSFDKTEDLYDFKVVGKEFTQIKSLPFDVSVLERYSKLKLCQLEQDWDDLGSWRSLINRRKALGKHNFNVFSSGQTVIALGSDEIVLVQNDDMLFVAHQDNLSDMSVITEYLQRNKLTDLLNCLEVYRPWGRFKVLAQDEHFIVKRLVISPHSQISLQSHQFRREHWVVVKGEAQVQLDDANRILHVGDAVCVEKGQKHRLSNHTDSVLEIIEVQSGEYLLEDDIVRYDDQYDRHKPN